MGIFTESRLIRYVEWQKLWIISRAHVNMQRFLQALRNDGTTDGLYKEIFEALTSNSVNVSELQGILSSRFD